MCYVLCCDEIYCLVFTAYLLKVKKYLYAYKFIYCDDAEWDISLHDAYNTDQQSITKYMCATFYLSGFLFTSIKQQRMIGYNQ